MTPVSFINAQIATPDGRLISGTLTCEGETITAVGDHAAIGEVIDVQGGYLLPGFIDTQVNGGGGVLFNDETTAEGIAAIGMAHRKYGTTPPSPLQSTPPNTTSVHLLHPPSEKSPPFSVPSSAPRGHRFRRNQTLPKTTASSEPSARYKNRGCPR